MSRLNRFVFRAPLAFPGQEDQGEETAYNIFRWYRSGWGRYTQSDPIGLNGGVNVFAYAEGGPTGFIDPFGLFSYIKDKNYSKCKTLKKQQWGP